ncbi:N-acyl-D-amino-acid deacylase family protein [Fusibacter ferrireducens]|uniref:D-aminoacylase n=1 Tax=Fusibacter ferrireducens TaxID=2785058 RepID=A0ABR9ZXT0_9FIRM|nr:D-aminoacylase [Fusibacter ferrireducens]MBF4694369.1 D-aminoacylase [Fusibacter ferrireducens]
MYDLVIKNGKIVSGTGEKSFIADVAIKDKSIVKIAPDLEDGVKNIDAGGLVVSPGFIDMHTHSDIAFIQDETCGSKLFQGVTTELAGCCGFSYYPSDDAGFERLKSYTEEKEYIRYVSKSLGEFVQKTEAMNKSINWGTYVGHGALRASIVGFGDVKATPEQIEAMKALLDVALSEGAFGLSLGIAYAPGMFCDTDELVELSKVVAKHGKIVTSHIRNENVAVFEAIEEMIEIGRASKAHVHISHLKLGYGSWHKTEELFDIIESSRAEGVNLTIEQYPYNASSTGLTAVLPNWVHEGGIDKILERFRDQRDEVIKGIEGSNSFEMGLDRVMVVSTGGFMPEADGKNIREISQMLGKSEAETVIYLLENTACTVPTIRFTMDDEDVLKIMSRKDCAVISDGSAYNIDPEKMSFKPHPRNYGTFPRFLKLNRQHQLMSLEDAVYKMTGLPAQNVHLENRGILKEGNYADITIFDYDKIEDTAVFNHSISKPIGVEYVIVNGKIAIDQGKLTSERSGEMLLQKS